MKRLFASGFQLSRGPIARSSILSMAIRLTGLIISFGQAILAARLLGASGYGVAAVTLAAVQIAATIASLGYGSLAVREIARLGAAANRTAIARFVRLTATNVAMLSAVVGALLVLLCATHLIPADYRTTMLVGGLAVPPLALLILQRGIAQGRGWILTAQAPTEILRPAMLAGFLLLWAALSWPLAPSEYVRAFAVAALATLVISAPFALRGLAGSGSTLQHPEDQGRWRAEAMPFLAISLVGILLAEVNTLLLGWLATPGETGLFQPVARLMPLMALPIQAAGMRFAPRIAELWEQGQHAMIARLTRVFTASTLALTIVAVIALASAGPWILAAFGDEFVRSANLLWIVGGAQVFNAACGPVGMLLTMRGRTSSALAGQISGLGANCLIGLLLIPRFGALGAVIATAGGIICWNLVMLVLLRRTRMPVS